MINGRSQKLSLRIASLFAGLLAFMVVWAAPVHAEAPAPTLSVSNDLARAGYYQLRWSLDDVDVVHYRVEESTDADFRETDVLYEGADRATVISGRSDGTFHYRVRAELADGTRTDWSDPQAVQVAHHPFGQAVFLFILGGVVFLATVILIIAGTRADRRERQRA
ncbi:hypothetical protein B1C78_02380 [Thioalkalivibrio denitrificans]|uniref:Fibronectin type-III domain-containing protein n=1 Tax=Thioalkalivibrio denitrificans TaxID=108003 RepID=A0A1V3NSJ2_9GAMM|nr:hypothetical protein [Thioalkalivibrio denitrificans]OOG28089.1 hypothetical protein B1C78_02380 [Thioalkalivibrio denitrificans]